MAEKSQRSGGRVSYDVLNNLSSVDLIYDDKRKKKTSQKKSLGIYQAERLIARKQDAEVSKLYFTEPFVTLSRYCDILFLSLVPILFFVFCGSQESQTFFFILFGVTKAILCVVVLNFPAYVVPLQPSLVR